MTVIRISMLKNLEEKIDQVAEQMVNFAREMETKKEPHGISRTEINTYFKYKECIRRA